MSIEEQQPNLPINNSEKSSSETINRASSIIDQVSKIQKQKEELMEELYGNFFTKFTLIQKPSKNNEYTDHENCNLDQYFDEFNDELESAISQNMFDIQSNDYDSIIEIFTKYFNTAFDKNKFDIKQIEQIPGELSEYKFYYNNSLLFTISMDLDNSTGELVPGDDTNIKNAFMKLSIDAGVKEV